MTNFDDDLATADGLAGAEQRRNRSQSDGRGRRSRRRRPSVGVAVGPLSLLAALAARHRPVAAFAPSTTTTPSLLGVGVVGRRRRRVRGTVVVRARDRVVVDAEIVEDEGDDDGDLTTLLDLALERDPSFADVRLPFVDPLGNRLLECRPHLVVTHDDVRYTIGTPHDHTVGIVGPDPNDDDDDEEALVVLDDSHELMDDLFRVASMHVSDASDDKLRLKRTPGTLTIQGDLDAFAEQGRTAREAQKRALFGDENDDDDDGASWRDALFDMELPDDPREEDAWVEATFRKYLGREYVELGDATESDDDDDYAELAGLFDSVLGADDDDAELASLLKDALEIKDDDDDDDEIDESDGASSPERTKPSTTDEGDAFAERLYTFFYKDKPYSLVRMTQPAVIVGREDGVESRRVLLTPEEARIILPQLETLCREELANVLPNDGSSTDAAP